ncbi:Fructose-2,6-bisphosphatase [Granulibacter bethesdensis CGDNIH4]|nr:Fructose-2,6-bisphosphatase [Granulibacter bethesdensis CGDNIH4]
MSARSPIAADGRAGHTGRMILLRHGQSEFNLHFTATRQDPGIHDPVLTEAGLAQAEAAAMALAGEGIERIFASPYTRTLQTARPIAQTLGLPLIITPLIRERYAFACDVGTPASHLAKDWPEHDFSQLDEIWWPSLTESEASILARAGRFRAEMAALKGWENTLVVTHWGFILSMTGQSLTNGEWIRCDPHQAGPDSIIWSA